jgi:hypothetical protein
MYVLLKRDGLCPGFLIGKHTIAKTQLFFIKEVEYLAGGLLEYVLFIIRIIHLFHLTKNQEPNSIMGQ